MAGDSYDVAIIGLGSAGLTAAQTAARLGLSTVAIERGRLGGDCLWGGCIPSKTLLASAKVAATARDAKRFGVDVGEVIVDRDAVWARIKEVQGQIAEADDNAQNYSDLGVDVREGPAQFVTAHQLDIGGERIRARHTIIATGSRPRIPNIPGIEDADPLTTDTIWELPAPPKELVIVGAGAAGVELAQGFARIGTAVTLVHRGEQILPLEEPSLAELLAKRLAGDGVKLVSEAKIGEVALVEGGTRRVMGTAGSGDLMLETSNLLVCCGREPNHEAIGVRGVGIDVSPEGIITDQRSRTTARNVYAVGDVAGRRHTHTAGYDAAQAVRDIALPGAGKQALGIPWAIFTDPELGHAGLTFSQAHERFPNKKVERMQRDLAQSDRARTDGDSPGRLVAISMNGKVVGVHLLAPGAGEAIGGIQASVSRRRRFTGLADQIEAYPTRTLELQRLAGERALEFAVKVRNQLPGLLKR